MLYSELYEFLDGFSEDTDNDIAMLITEEWTNNQVESFVETLFKLLKIDYFEKPSFFNFYSDSTLSGAAYPCSALECRLANLDNLTRFAALYGDKVLIPSPIDLHFEKLEQGKCINRMELVVDVIILLRLKPLVLAGIVGFFSTYICLCQECLKKVVKKEELLEEQLGRIYSYINQDCIKNVKCELA